LLDHRSGEGGSPGTKEERAEERSRIKNGSKRFHSVKKKNLGGAGASATMCPRGKGKKKRECLLVHRGNRQANKADPARGKRGEYGLSRM